MAWPRGTSPGNDTILGVLRVDKAVTLRILLPSPPLLVGTKGIACTWLHSTSKSFPLPVGRPPPGGRGERKSLHTTEIQDSGETTGTLRSSPLKTFYKALTTLVKILCFLQQNYVRILIVVAM